MPAHLYLATPHTAGSRRDTAAPISVVLADDHVLVRRSLRQLLAGEQGMRVIGEAVDVRTAMRDVQRHRPQVLVLALQMAHGSSIEAIGQLRSQVPETEIVASTMEPSPLFAQQAMDAGAVGFVLKDRADSELPVAVRAAAGGREYVSPQVAAGLDALRRAVSSEGLTPRETEILRLIALGHTSREIADKLQVSRRTVETHRARIHSKLGLATRAELVGYALRHLVVN
jgi:two-component system, NarL family, response regulator NreC